MSSDESHELTGESSSAVPPAVSESSRVTVSVNEEIHDIGDAAEVEGDSHLASEALEDATQPFVGRWNRLVSTTNWEKGRIILQWRESLQESGAAATEFSDDAWAQRVGGLSGQHAGRLRRVYQRFGATCDKFDGLYWSHFQAGIDWNDAEMWLEGAVQNRWSVSQMRHQRWDSLGQIEEVPADADIVLSELDEDMESGTRQRPDRDSTDETRPLPEGPDFGDEDEGTSISGDTESTVVHADDASISASSREPLQPFAEIDRLPDDVQDAFESFKLAIIRHKSEGWEQISCDDMLGCLDSLKQLAVIPA